MEGAGYSTAGKHWRQDFRKLKAKLQGNINLELYDIIDIAVPRALDTVIEIMQDSKQPGATRDKCAARILSLAGMDKAIKVEVEHRAVEQFSESELNAKIRELSEKVGLQIITEQDPETGDVLQEYIED